MPEMEFGKGIMSRQALAKIQDVSFYSRSSIHFELRSLSACV